MKSKVYTELLTILRNGTPDSVRKYLIFTQLCRRFCKAMKWRSQATMIAWAIYNRVWANLCSFNY